MAGRSNRLSVQKPPGTRDFTCTNRSEILKDNSHTFLKGLKLRDHLCLLYENQDDWLTSIVPFIQFTLEHSHKFIYAADHHTQDDLIQMFSSSGLDIEKYITTGQFLYISTWQIYAPDGCFKPDRTINLLIEEIKKAIEQGYSALSVTGEMSWALKDIEGSQRLLEYESKLNSSLFNNYPCLAVCQYSLSTFDSETIKDILKTHPKLIFRGKILGNCYYMPTKEFLGDKRSENEVKHWLENLE
jgi:hypothetical protein